MLDACPAANSSLPADLFHFPTIEAYETADAAAEASFCAENPGEDPFDFMLEWERNHSKPDDVVPIPLFADTYTIRPFDEAVDDPDYVPSEKRKPGAIYYSDGTLAAEAPLPKPQWCIDLQAEIDALQAQWQERDDYNQAWFAFHDAAGRRYLAKFPDADEDAVRAYQRLCAEHQKKREQRAKTPKQIPKPLPLLRRYVFIRASGAYYDLMTLTNCAVNTVHLMCRKYMPVGYAGGMPAFMMASVRSYDRLAYAPDKPPEFTDNAGLSCLNIYKPSGLLPMVGSARPWVDHVHMMFGDDVEAREHFFDWLAFKFQNPARKLRHAVAIQSVQGTGKDTLAKPLISIFGDNAVEPSNTQILKGQMGFLENKLLVVVSELRAENNRFVSDQLKPLITQETNTIELKYVNPYKIETPCAFLCFTNWENPIFLEDSDRRWWLYTSKMKPQSGEYYAKLHKWLDRDGTAYVYRWLLDRDVSKFNPDCAPPMTVAKQQTIEASRGETRNGLLELWHDQKAPFGDGSECSKIAFLNLRQAVSWLRQENPKVSEELLKRFLRGQGAGPFLTPSGAHEPTRYKRNGVACRERLWLLRGDPVDWHGRSQEDIGAAVWHPPHG